MPLLGQREFLFEPAFGQLKVMRADEQPFRPVNGVICHGKPLKQRTRQADGHRIYGLISRMLILINPTRFRNP